MKDFRGTISMTIEARIVENFLKKLEADQSIPQEVVNSLRVLQREGKLKDAEAVLGAIREGVKEHAKNTAT